MMRKSAIFVVIFFTYALGAQAAIAQPAPGAFECEPQASALDAKLVVARVEEQYEKFTGLTAKFSQSSYFLGLGKEVNSEGAVAFKKPGMMDWNYLRPDAQRFVTNGATLWFFEPKVNQVTLADFTSSFDSDLPASFLLGVGKLSENFSTEKACSTVKGTVLKLTPKEPDPNLSEFLLLVDKSTYVPIGAKIIDAGGNETKIVFEEIKLEAALPAERFVFEIPRGVDIIDHRGKQAAARPGGEL